MPDGDGEGIPAPAGGIGGGLVEDAVLGEPLAHAADDAGLQHLGIEEGRHAGPELAEDLGAIALGVVLLHALEVVGRERGIHLGGAPPPHEHRRLVPREVPPIEIPEGAALAGRRGQDHEPAAGGGQGRPHGPEHLQVLGIPLGVPVEAQLVEDRDPRAEPADGRRPARVGGHDHAVPERERVRRAPDDRPAEERDRLEDGRRVAEERAEAPRKSCATIRAYWPVPPRSRGAVAASQAARAAAIWVLPDCRPTTATAVW